ncbi:MAG: lipopolysaccharide assembly protein LapB [Gammaproteobacteria bacterium]|nr:lipopolysaccharide assembly protein LapB [Gammaproteobacteria bacterium]HBW84240.1 lipopolysaccharide assembly protein LapB [Gammaproteobacteria bacterium]
MQGVEIYVLLLMATGGGWLLGRISSRRTKPLPRATQDIFHEYFAGLNYLLNDEPDEAIDTFIKALEVNGETIQTHLALGALLRRRGKVDKAVKVHQALLARPGLEPRLEDASRLQLAKDYIAAGLLDRAERLLKELTEGISEGKWDALPLLISIYQLEKEWHRAINSTKELLTHARYRRSKEWRARAVHYHCEIAESLIAGGQVREARRELRRGAAFQRQHLRASLLTAQLEYESGNYKGAIRECRRIAEHSPRFFPQLLDAMEMSYSELGREDEFIKFLDGFVEMQADPAALRLMSRFIYESQGVASAIRYLRKRLDAQPSLTAAAKLLELEAIANKKNHEVVGDLEKVNQVLSDILTARAGYQCSHCGYEARQLNWLCPGCQSWDSIQPKVGEGY